MKKTPGKEKKTTQEMIYFESKAVQDGAKAGWAVPAFAKARPGELAEEAVARAVARKNGLVVAPRGVSHVLDSGWLDVPLVEKSSEPGDVGPAVWFEFRVLSKQPKKTAYALQIWGRGSNPVPVGKETYDRLVHLGLLWAARTGRVWKPAGVAAALFAVGRPRTDLRGQPAQCKVELFHMVNRALREARGVGKNE